MLNIIFVCALLPRTAWVLGRVVCKAVPYLQGVSVNASVYTLVAISIDRYVVDGWILFVIGCIP